MIRSFEARDAAQVAELIALTMRAVNIRDYSPEYIESNIRALTPDFLVSRMSWTHGYVDCEGDAIVGCGFIGPYWGRADESSLFTIK